MTTKKELGEVHASLRNENIRLQNRREELRTENFNLRQEAEELQDEIREMHNEIVHQARRGDIATQAVRAVSRELAHYKALSARLLAAIQQKQTIPIVVFPTNPTDEELENFARDLGME